MKCHIFRCVICRIRASEGSSPVSLGTSEIASWYRDATYSTGRSRVTRSGDNSCIRSRTMRIQGKVPEWTYSGRWNHG